MKHRENQTFAKLLQSKTKTPGVNATEEIDKFGKTNHTLCGRRSQNRRRKSCATENTIIIVLAPTDYILQLQTAKAAENSGVRIHPNNNCNNEYNSTRRFEERNCPTTFPRTHPGDKSFIPNKLGKDTQALQESTHNCKNNTHMDHSLTKCS
jgi:hypothetical protein